MLTPFGIVELSTATAVIVAAVAGLARQLEQSRCTTIDCCCVKCTRAVPPPPATDSAQEEGADSGA
jgi:hypothetical protein